MRALVCILSLLIASSAYAASAPKPAPGVLTKRKMHEAAVRLIDVMNANGTVQQQIDESINAQLEGMKTMPCADVLTNDVRKILSDAMSYSAMKGDIADIYANSFTLDELEWMLDFYKTKLGEKILKVQPAVYQAMSEITNKRLKEAEPKIATLFASTVNTTKCPARR